jgi:small subunit ribosomal protein S2
MNTESNRIDEMFTVGAHFGYSKARRHPSAAPFIFTTKNGVDIINIEKTEVELDRALDFVSKLAQSGKNILFIGTKAEAKEVTALEAGKIGMPYVNSRWIGGTLTNFPEIKKRVTKLVELREAKEKGELEKYTKKERLMIDREVEDMEKKFSGIVGMQKTPDVIFVVDPKKEYIAVTEAKNMNIPVVSLLNTDCNSKVVDYPIIGNDGSLSSISFFVKAISKAYAEGQEGKTEA